MMSCKSNTITSACRWAARNLDSFRSAVSAGGGLSPYPDDQVGPLALLQSLPNEEGLSAGEQESYRWRGSACKAPLCSKTIFRGSA